MRRPKIDYKMGWAVDLAELANVVSESILTKTVE
jgi:hypothetical protein